LSLETGKTDKMDTVTWLRLLGPTLSDDRKKNQEIGLIVRLQMNTNVKPSLSSIHYKLSPSSESGLNGYETGETSWK